MRKLAICVCIAILFIGCTATGTPKSDTATPAWMTLTQAYRLRQVGVIENYARSSNKPLRFYATALLDLSSRDFASLPKDGKACNTASPVNGTEAVAYWYCLLVVSTGLRLAHQPKLSYLWKARFVAFYKRYSELINAAGIRPKQVSKLSVEAVKAWPRQTVSTLENWSPIPMQNGTATAYIDGKPIQVLVDTGSTVINLSKEDVERYGLASSLVQLNLTGRALDNTGGLAVHLYYVKRFRLGPIAISNAYVVVRPNSGKSSLPGSRVGINALAALKRFTISASMISPFSSGKGESACGRMMFTPHKIALPAEFPFFKVTTSAGRMGVFLDSGNHWIGPLSNLGITLNPREKSKLKGNGLIAIEKKNIKIHLAQNGKSKAFLTDLFRTSISGVQTQGIFVPLGPVGPLAVGAMTFNFLKEAKVAYDFPDRKMCIIPLSNPASTVDSEL